jgi:HAD superfamily hydrolase (TIGR01509 family)
MLLTASSVEELQPRPEHVALLFDWDGTLADSQYANFLSIRDALRTSGLDIDQEWFDTRTGVSTREMVALVAELAERDVDVDAVAAERDTRYLERLSTVGEVGHIADLLRREHGTRRTALATGGGARTVLPTVDALELRPYFDAVVTREDVEKGKPSPDIFLRAAQLLDADLAGCLVYEDSDEGIEAAHAAGMDVIDVRALRRRES